MTDWMFYQLKTSEASSYSHFRYFWPLKSPNIAKNRAGWIVCTLLWWVLKMGLRTFVSHLLIAFLLQTQYPAHGSSTGYISPFNVEKFLNKWCLWINSLSQNFGKLQTRTLSFSNLFPRQSFSLLMPFCWKPSSLQKAAHFFCQKFQTDPSVKTQKQPNATLSSLSRALSERD